MVHAILAVFSLRREAVTIDEYAHLPAGISHWQKGAFFVYNVNPPLIKMLAALPVLPMEPHMVYPEPFQPRVGIRQEWSFGQQFMENNRERYFKLFFVGRYPSVVLSVLGGWIVFLWSRKLYGPASGLVGVALWCFCPNVLAYAGQITPDIGAATMTVASCFVYWLWLRSPTWRKAIAAGALLGIAQLTKFTLLLLYPVWGCLWIMWQFDVWRQYRESCPASTGTPILVSGRPFWFRARFFQLSAIFLSSVFVLNLGYACDGSGKPLGEFNFVSQALTAEHLHQTPLSADEREALTARYSLVVCHTSNLG